MVGELAEWRQLKEREVGSGAGRGAGKPRQPGMDACVDESVDQSGEHRQTREGDHRELQRPGTAGDIGEQRNKVAQELDSLAGARLALAGMARPENKRHVGHAESRRAHEQLEQDLETPRLQLQAFDGGKAAAEEAAQRVAGAASLGKYALREPRARPADEIAHRAIEPGSTSTWHVA